MAAGGSSGKLPGDWQLVAGPTPTLYTQVLICQNPLCKMSFIKKRLNK